MYYLAPILIGLLTSFSIAHAQNFGALSILTAQQGGTGIGSVTAGDVGNCLKVLSNSPFKFELGSCGTGSGSTFGKAFEIISGYLTPTTTQTILANGGFVSQASSTVVGPLTVTGTSTLGTTTSSFANGVMVVDGTHYAKNSIGINNAITDCAALYPFCGIVQLPVGTTSLSTNMPIAPTGNIWLRGHGKGRTILVPDASATGANGDAIRLVVGVASPYKRNIKISDLTIDMTSQYSGSPNGTNLGTYSNGITLQGVDYSEFENIEIINPFGFGILVGSDGGGQPFVKYPTFRNITITGERNGNDSIGGGGIDGGYIQDYYFRDGYGTVNDFTNVQDFLVKNVYATRTSSSIYSLSTAWGFGTDFGAKGITYDNVNIDGAYFGIATDQSTTGASSTDIKIVNSTIKNIYKTLIYMPSAAGKYTTNVQIIGNKFANWNMDGSSAQGIVLKDTQRGIIANNVFGTSTNAAFAVSYQTTGAASGVDYFDVHDNDFTAMTQTPFQFTAQGSNNEIHNNNGYTTNNLLGFWGIGTSTLVSGLGNNVRAIIQGSGLGRVLLGSWAGDSTYGAIGFAGSLSSTDYNIMSGNNDTNLYINRPANRDIKFRENNVDTITFLRGGNVGVGTTSPYAKLSVVGETVAAFFTATTSATSTLAGGLQANLLNVTSSSATSTFANGINVTGGCFAINGTCLSTGSSFSYPFPSAATSTTLTFGGGLVAQASSTFTSTFRLPSLSDGTLNVGAGTVYSGATTTFGTGYSTTTQNSLTHSTSTATYAGMTFGLTITSSAGALTFTPTTTGALTNAALANSTISGIALGSNLADLAATDATLTFSGSYNGSTARTVGLNLANANTWTALQQFGANASSSIFSAYRAYFGGTATTTITGTGFLGIATSTPTSPLTVSGTDFTTFQNSTNGIATLVGTQLTGNNYVSLDFSQAQANSNRPMARIAGQQTGSGSNLVFGTSNNYALGITNTSMLIDFNGRVGIASTSPYSRFAIHGNNGSTITTLFAVGSSTNAATTTLFSINNQGLTTMVYASTTALSSSYASSTLGVFGTASTTQLTFGGVTGTAWSSFCTSITGSADLCDGSDATGGGASFGWPFTPTTNFGVTNQATTGIAWFQNGLNASSTSHFTDAEASNSLGAPTVYADTLDSWTGTAPLSFPSNALFGDKATVTNDLFAANLFANIARFNSFQATSTATSTITGGLDLKNLNLTGSSATNTAANGFNLSGGCFAVNGNCIGGGSFSNTLASGGTATTTFFQNGVVYSDGTKLTQSTLFTFTTASTTINNQLIIPNDVTATPHLRFGSGANVSDWGFSFAADRFMIGYDDSDNGYGFFGVGSGKGMKFNVGGTNGVYKSGTTALLLNDAGDVGIGSTTPWSKLSVMDGTYPVFTVATTSGGNPIVQASATTTGNKDWARFSIGTSTESGIGQYFPLAVQGAVYSTKRYIACEIPTLMGNLTADGTRVCQGTFDFDEDAQGATDIGVETDGTEFIRVWAGVTASTGALVASGNGAAIAPTNGGSAGAFTSASSSPIFEARVALSNVNATATAALVGLYQGATGANWDGLQSTLSPGYYFMATSTNNWQACAAETGAGTTASCVDTGVASTSGASVYNTMRIHLGTNRAGLTTATYVINNFVVGQITRSGTSAKASLNPVVAIGALNQAGFAKAIKVAYLRAWADTVPNQSN